MSKIEIQPQESSRARAFEMWMSSPMPMVTMVKTLDVSRLVKMSKRTDIKFNTLLCWCIGKAAGQIDEFYLLLEKGKLYRFDQIAINVIVDNLEGGINSCDIPYSDDLQQFNCDYLTLTAQAANECRDTMLDGYVIIGTSAMIQTEFDCVINQYTEKYSNPFLIWGRYRKKWLRYELPLSIQFHHVLMDGGHAARFLQRLQDEIRTITTE